MSATLGGLIKDYRLQKNISQLEIAFAFGWNETSRLSRIEQGKVSNPSHEFIDKLSAVMKLEEEEKNELLLVGNYLPNDKEINLAKEIYDPLISNWPYPASVCDFSWRVIATNSVHNKIYRVTNNLIKDIGKFQINMLDILFNKDYFLNLHLKGNALEQWHFFLTEMLAQFMFIQKSRSKEDWYISLVKKMMSNPLFKQLWQKAQFVKKIGIVKNFGFKKLIHPEDNNKFLDFYFFLEPLAQDPRFQIELHVPANKETYEYFQKSSVANK